MSGQDALRGFLDKWQARWPEWAVGMVFIPENQREIAAAWLALRDELADAAWGGADARPGEAKLAWWGDELQGWAKGARRHPLGVALQKQPAAWQVLGEALPALSGARGVGAVDAAIAAVSPFAARASEVEQVLFGGNGEASSSSAHAAALLAERLSREAEGGVADDVASAAKGLLAAWPASRAATRPIRIHHAFVRRRLQRLASGQSPLPGRFTSLFDAWNAARG